MKTKALRLICLVLCVVIAGPVLAQEGHPLVGSWVGSWGPTPEHRNHVVLVMKWDGKEISGTINPGPNAIALKTAMLDPSDWTVQFEAEARDRGGNLVAYTIEGKIEALGSPNRYIVGTWSHGTTKGDFRVQMQ